MITEAKLVALYQAIYDIVGPWSGDCGGLLLRLLDRKLPPFSFRYRDGKVVTRLVDGREMVINVQADLCTQGSILEEVR